MSKLFPIGGKSEQRGKRLFSFWCTWQPPKCNRDIIYDRKKDTRGTREEVTWAGLHDNVPADSLPSLQKVHQWAPCNSVQMYWCPRLGDNFCRAIPPCGIVTVFNFKCHSRQLAPNMCNLGRGVGLGRCRATRPSIQPMEGVIGSGENCRSYRGQFHKLCLV